MLLCVGAGLMIVFTTATAMPAHGALGDGSDLSGAPATFTLVDDPADITVHA